MKFATTIADTLQKEGFTHFFFVGGGNIMHLTGALAEKLTPVPVIHEVAAVIASEYFNKACPNNKSLALVTAGPGITNCISGLAGAFIESRGVLILGGQVKTSDLSRGNLRQRGIQEIDGISICQPLCKVALRLEHPIPKEDLVHLFQEPFVNRQGPVFLEIPLDVQASDQKLSQGMTFTQKNAKEIPTVKSEIEEIADAFNAAQRPMFLIGGGSNQNTTDQVLELATKFRIPVTTTWNGAETVPYDHGQHFGRPNTWGQRSANIILQQSDLLIALGSRMGLQQTGFNWQEFLPNGKLVMVDISNEELNKGHPHIAWKIRSDCADFVSEISPLISGDWSEWCSFARHVRDQLPINEKKVNFSPPKGFVQPYDFVDWLSQHCRENDNIVPCSSGSANTCMMQNFQQKRGQSFFNNKGLASMGYGLSGAIGVAMARPSVSTYLVEGDGGFAQNVQELGTVGLRNLNIKMFIFDDAGHASIRLTQKNYFEGNYIGCDIATGLGLPNWDKIGEPWGIPTAVISDLKQFKEQRNRQLLEASGPAIFVLKIHPEQTYYPKISSFVTAEGGMKSNPLHKMSPELNQEQEKALLKFLQRGGRLKESFKKPLETLFRFFL